jgi:hypothetical protein
MVIINGLEKCVMVINLTHTEARTKDSENKQQIPPNTVPPEVEQKILWSFGNAIIEFESTLYEKFRIISGGIILSMNEFRWHLENMEERGILVSSKFLGLRSWSRLS